MSKRRLLKEWMMKQSIKKCIRRLFVLLLVFVLYCIIGGIVPFIGHPDVSDETKAKIEQMDFYSGGVGPDRATIIEDNGAALSMRLKMIADAQEHIVLSTFEFRSDESGKDVLAALYDAAQRDVSVEIFVDGLNSLVQMERNPYFYALSAHPNVRILEYNRVNLLKPWNVAGRMHDKYLMIDERMYLLGGRNTYGYFLGDYPGHKNYDRDVLVYNTGAQDSSIYQLKTYYEQITAMKCCGLFHNDVKLSRKKKVQKAAEELQQRYQSLRKKYRGFLDETYDYEKNTVQTNHIQLLSNPTTRYAKEPVVFYGLMALAKQAKTEVRIHTPYIICDEDMYDSLRAVADKTTIMTNSVENNGNLFGAVDYLYHKKDILDTGVTIEEYEGGISYHGKSMTVDDDIAVIGSFNFDMRSAYIDTELMLVIHSREVNRQLRDAMAQYEQSAATVQDEQIYKKVPDGMQMKPLSGMKKNIKRWFGPLMEQFRFLF